MVVGLVVAVGVLTCLFLFGCYLFCFSHAAAFLIFLSFWLVLGGSGAPLGGPGDLFGALGRLWGAYGRLVGPKWPPRWPQEAAKWAQEAPKGHQKAARRWFLEPKNGPKGLQKAIKRSLVEQMPKTSKLMTLSMKMLDFWAWKGVKMSQH